MAKIVCALFLILCICVLAICAKTGEGATKRTGGARDQGNLSDEEHYNEKGEHNSEYDHEAFLGNQKKSFDQLTPEESKERLGKIIDKIDKDQDGKITAKELGDWIELSKTQYNKETVNKRWGELVVRLQSLLSQEDSAAGKTVDPDAPVSWEEYKTASYGEKPEESDIYRDQMVLEERRWKAADLDQDGKLTREEYAAMYHPWDHKHMHDSVAQERLVEMDKDKDGLLSLQEYLDDLHRKSEKDMTEEELKQKDIDRAYFHSHRDTNKDGVMDKGEVKEWMFPSNFDPIKSEANHLIYHADTDKDKVLTKDEIVKKYNVFVGSTATNYGKDLTKHDEF